MGTNAGRWFLMWRSREHGPVGRAAAWLRLIGGALQISNHRHEGSLAQHTFLRQNAKAASGQFS